MNNSRTIHCNHNHHFRRHTKNRRIKGSTWILSSVPNEPQKICVQYSICNKQDNYSRSVGYELAKISREIIMYKTELLKFIESTRAEHMFDIELPSMYALYHATHRI